MVVATPRFTERTVGALVQGLLVRQAALFHCVESLRLEATEAHRGRDLSDLLDHQDPSADLDTQTTLIFAQRAEDHLREVEQALDRVAAGSYGFCLGCGGGIPLERLRALPAAALCIECRRRSPDRVRRIGSAAIAGEVVQ